MIQSYHNLHYKFEFPADFELAGYEPDVADATRFLQNKNKR